MRPFLLVLAILLSLASLSSAQTTFHVDRRTKQAELVANMRQDHSIIGYAAPKVTAPKLILFSIFTSEVEGNPGRYPLGAYYETSKLKPGTRLVFVGKKAGFVQLNYLAPDAKPTPVYVRQQDVAFD